MVLWPVPNKVSPQADLAVLDVVLVTFICQKTAGNTFATFSDASPSLLSFRAPPPEPAQRTPPLDTPPAKTKTDRGKQVIQLGGLKGIKLLPDLDLFTCGEASRSWSGAFILSLFPKFLMLAIELVREMNRTKSK